METLFLTVLQMGISASWLILAIAAVRILFSGIPRNMFCMMWMAAGLRLICPWKLQTDFSLLPERKNVFFEGSPARLLQEDLTETASVPGHSAAASRQNLATDQLPGAPASGNLPETISAAAGWLWLAGIFAMCMYLAVCWYHVKKAVAEAVPAESEGIRFYQCDRITSPFLFGLASPKIYVPFSVSGQELSYVLQHETMHKKRLDHLAKLAGYLLLSVYWFQPLVWAGYLLFCRDIELACDERVIRQIGEARKKEYSKALLTCSVNHRTAMPNPVAFGEIGVKKRVKKILAYKIPKLRTVLAAAIVCAAVTLGFGTEAKGSNSFQPQSGTQAKTGAETNPELEERITEWAIAFCGRDVKTIRSMQSPASKKALQDQNLQEGEHSFGWSSPWPWNMDQEEQQPDYRIVSIGDTSAEILYYAWTSDPHVTVWRQVITYPSASGKDTFRIQDVSFEVLDSIHSAKQFYTAYPGGVIDGTRMDYLHGNSAGEALNQNAKDFIRELYQPDTAAVYLLNLQPDTQVKTKKAENGKTTVLFTFPQDGGSASVTMIQPYGKKGIWIPQTDTVSMNGGI